MTRLSIVMCASILLFSSCAALSEKGRMEQLQETAKAYEHALLRADYRTAADFIDPDMQQADTNYDQYKKIKIVDCRPTRIKVSEDKLSVKRDVELQYFLLDRNILRNTRYQQQWKYNEEEKEWLMKNGLPIFETTSPRDDAK